MQKSTINKVSIHFVQDIGIVTYVMAVLKYMLKPLGKNSSRSSRKVTMFCFYFVYPVWMQLTDYELTETVVKYGQSFIKVP